MAKIWLECQKCGYVFWVFSDEIGKFYPSRHVNYQLCSKCESESK